MNNLHRDDSKSKLPLIKLSSLSRDVNETLKVLSGFSLNILFLFTLTLELLFLDTAIFTPYIFV